MAALLLLAKWGRPRDEPSPQPSPCAQGEGAPAFVQIREPHPTTGAAEPWALIKFRNLRDSQVTV